MNNKVTKKETPKGGQQQKDEIKDAVRHNFFLYDYLDLDSSKIFLFFAAFRTFQCLFMSTHDVYPDEYWQGTEVAYNIVYGGVNLPWEWWSEFRLRNVVYPYYLSIPLWILKFTGLDTPFMVRLSPYMAHSTIAVAADYFFYRLAKKLVGIQAARLAFLMYFCNDFVTSFMVRCFGNSVETMLHLLVFNYYLEISNKFDKNLALVAFWLSIGMGIRNTSIMGWAPLLLLKMFQKSAYVSFILAGLFVAIPTFGLIVLLDSIYFGGLTFTAWNFFLINVFENRSAYFGVSPWQYYFEQTMPEAFHLLLPAVAVGVVMQIRKAWAMREVPVTLLFAAINLVIVSRVEHKECRFILPIVPYLIIAAGGCVAKLVGDRSRGKLITYILLVLCTYDLYRFHRPAIESRMRLQLVDYIKQIDSDPNADIYVYS